MDLYELWIFNTVKDEEEGDGYWHVRGPEWQDLIKSIHKEILYRDQHWHRFYEGYYVIIRCQKRFLSKVKRFLEEKEIEYGYKGVWKDGSPTVSKYQHIYGPLFHYFTMMSLEKYDEIEEFSNIFDRVVHCFLNHQFYNLEQARDTYGEWNWEAKLLAHNLVNRSFYQGTISGRQQTAREVRETTVEEGKEEE